MGLAPALALSERGDDRRRLAVRAAVHQRPYTQGRQEKHISDRPALFPHTAHLVPSDNDLPRHGAWPRA